MPNTHSTPDQGLQGAITADDVHTLYQIVLGREPESADIVAQHVRSGASRAEYLSSLLASAERGRAEINNLNQSFFLSRRPARIDVSGAPEELQRLQDHIHGVWTEYGEEDPYWSVMTNEEFHGALDPAAERLFYETGRAHVDAFLAIAADNDVAVPLDGTVLDLGCGVARLGEHLSALFHAYVGVDISAPHLRIAGERLRKLGRNNVRLELLPDFLADGSRFDALSSLIVLQHNPPPVIVDLLDRLLGRLNPGGVAFFQLPCFLHDYEFVLRDYLNGLGDGGSMEMHAVPQREIFRLADKNGCEVIELVPDGMIGNIGRSYTFLIRKPRE